MDLYTNEIVFRVAGGLLGQQAAIAKSDFHYHGLRIAKHLVQPETICAGINPITR